MSRYEATPKPTTKTRRDHIKAKLKAMGHKAEKVDKLKLDTEDDVLSAVCEMHGLTVGEYKRLVGGR